MTHDDFYDKKRQKVRADGSVHRWVGKYAHCKSCTDSHNKRARSKYKQWYADYRANNKEKISARTRAFAKQARVDWTIIIGSSVELKCQECGYDKTFAALDFHHRDPKEKDFIISRVLKLARTEENVAMVMAEVKKCDVLCANCHRERHTKFDPIRDRDESLKRD